MAQHRALEPRRQALDDLVVSRAVYVDALGGHADLARRVEDPGEQAIHGGFVQQRIRQDQRRVVAPEL